MAVHIIIDGYNLIRRSPDLSPLDRRSLESGRSALIDQLAAYRKVRAHRITVVFDGSDQYSFFDRKDRQKGISIRFSRQGETADGLIQQMAEIEREKALVVSSDQAVLDFCAARGSAVISAEAFLRKMETAALIHLKKDGVDVEENTEWSRSTRKKGPSRRPSKKRRRNLKKLQKL